MSMEIKRTIEDSMVKRDIIKFTDGRNQTRAASHLKERNQGNLRIQTKKKQR